MKYVSLNGGDGNDTLNGNDGNDKLYRKSGDDYIEADKISGVANSIKNEKQRQSYYGAINYRTGKVIVEEYSQGNTENTIKFIKYLREKNQKRRLVIIWDGATYHHSQEFKEYLAKVNQGKVETD